MGLEVFGYNKWVAFSILVFICRAFRYILFFLSLFAFPVFWSTFYGLRAKLCGIWVSGDFIFLLWSTFSSALLLYCSIDGDV